MRQFVLAMACLTAVGFAPTCGYGQNYGPLYMQRSEPPIETSIPVPDKAAVAPMPAMAAMAKAEPAAPKPVQPRPIVRRMQRVAARPLTMPAPEVLVMMVRSALAAVQQANFTENYSVLHAMTTPALQTRVSAGQFGAAFANLRKQNIDLSPMLVMPPQFTAAPTLTPQGLLRLTGSFPSRPLQINFAIDYRPVDGFWLIDGLSVSAVQASTVQAARPEPVPQPLPTAGRVMDGHPIGLWDTNVNTLMFGPSVRWGAGL